MKKYKMKFRLLPVIVFSAVIILIMRAHTFHVDIDNLPNLPYNSSRELWDVFCYSKASAILYVTIWAVLTLGYLLITGQIKIKKTMIYIPMAIYTITVVLSYVMSDNRAVAWAGCPNRFEGTRTILCYMFMLFYTINVVDEDKDVAAILTIIAGSDFLNCLIGLTQLLKHDIFLTDLAGVLITGGGDNSLQATFWPGQVYQTVYNMNYVGMYLSLIIPMLVYIIYYCSRSSNRLKLMSFGMNTRKCQTIILLSGLLLLLIGMNVYGADSLGAALGICVSLALLLVVLLQKRGQKIAVLTIMAAGAIGVLSFMYISGADRHKQLDYIETGIDTVKMSINGNELNVNYIRKEDTYELRDSRGKKISTFLLDIEDIEGMYNPDDGRFAGEVLIVPLKDKNGEPCVVVDLRDQAFGFTFYEDGAKYLNPYGGEVSLSKTDSWGFKGRLSAGSGRGYIWSRTFPLLKNCLFLGNGADTFLLMFPQDDYAGKYSAGSPIYQTCDKAHSMYLHMAVGTGLFSVIAYLVMIAMAVYMAFSLGRDKLYVKIMAAGIVGFLFAAVFNDSSVCTMPMFYGMLGSTIAMSMKQSAK